DLGFRPAKQLGGAVRRPLDRQPVEAETPDAILPMPAPGHWIEKLVGGEARVKGGIEGRNLRDFGQQFPGGMNPQRGHPVVEGRELGKRFDSLEYPVVDARGRAIPAATVNHPMPDGVDVLTTTNPDFSKQA